jgi:hypothetical protein
LLRKGCCSAAVLTAALWQSLGSLYKWQEVLQVEVEVTAGCRQQFEVWWQLRVERFAEQNSWHLSWNACALQVQQDCGKEFC